MYSFTKEDFHQKNVVFADSEDEKLAYRSGEKRDLHDFFQPSVDPVKFVARTCCWYDNDPVFPVIAWEFLDHCYRIQDFYKLGKNSPVIAGILMYDSDGYTVMNDGVTDAIKAIGQFFMKTIKKFSEFVGKSILRLQTEFTASEKLWGKHGRDYEEWYPKIKDAKLELSVGIIWKGNSEWKPAYAKTMAMINQLLLECENFPKIGKTGAEWVKIFDTEVEKLAQKKDTLLKAVNAGFNGEGSMFRKMDDVVWNPITPQNFKQFGSDLADAETMMGNRGNNADKKNTEFLNKATTVLKAFEDASDPDYKEASTAFKKWSSEFWSHTFWCYTVCFGLLLHLNTDYKQYVVESVSARRYLKKN